MNRENMIKELAGYDGYWDFVVIGGGATGLGVGLDAASRGYKTLLLEQHDFSKGTSSRSTKLVHGGVRYLRQGNISLVLEALHERGLLIRSRVVVNATGVFTDEVLKMENPDAESIITPSQGVHVILDKEFLPGDSAIMVPQTTDGRVLFAVPWHDKVVVGTTDTQVPDVSLEPRALEGEIKFILDHAAVYLTKDPTRADVQSVFAGLRPLVKAGDGKSTAAISRDHYLVVSESGLVTITGGKWTTYRKMAEDTVNQAALVAGLNDQPCVTKDLRIHGWLKHFDEHDPLSYYGSDAVYIKKIVNADPSMGEKLHQKLSYIKAEVIWAVREEMARTVEDFLARRSRALFLDARASIDAVPEVARIMAEELGYDRTWQMDQETAYVRLAKEYLLT